MKYSNTLIGIIILLFSLNAKTLFSQDQQVIQIPAGWSYFSTYIIPNNNSIDSISAPYVSDIVIIKDGAGNVFWPQMGVNMIGSFTIGEGYQIKAFVPFSFQVNGVAIQPENNPILVPQGWSILGYLRTEPAPLDSMLDSIITNIIIVKNFSGFIFWPFLSTS